MFIAYVSRLRLLFRTKSDDRWRRGVIIMIWAFLLGLTGLSAALAAFNQRSTSSNEDVQVTEQTQQASDEVVQTDEPTSDPQVVTPVVSDPPEQVEVVTDHAHTPTTHDGSTRSPTSRCRRRGGRTP